MSIADTYRQRLRNHTTRESMDTLAYMRDFFGNGANWTQGVYHGPDGRKCIVGAADHVRVSSLDNAKYWLLRAIAETAPGITSIEQFNDTRSDYAEVARVIARAEQLATAARLPAPSPVMPVRALPAPLPVLEGEILPPVQPALPVPMPVYELRPAAMRTPAPLPAGRRSLADWIWD
jgi:hypothetical protein